MTRDEAALEILKTLLTTDQFSYNSTNEAVYDAVELTDLLAVQLARPAGTVKVVNFDDEQEVLEERNEVVTEHTTEKKRSFFNF